MNPEEYIIIKKSDFERIEKFFYIDGALQTFPLKPLLEETFEASREMEFEGKPVELEHLCDEASYNYRYFKDFIKQKEI